VQQLGIGLGSTDGFIELHYLLEDAFDGERFDPHFPHQVMAKQSFHTHPIYAILHESIYAEGAATRWAAERTRAEHPGLNFVPGGRFSFTGEMVFPWMFEQFRDCPAGRPHLPRGPTGALPRPPRAQQGSDACIVYADDMFVDLDPARRAANANARLDHQREHNGLRPTASASDRLDRLNRDR
jgi:hypothetical protein